MAAMPGSNWWRSGCLVAIAAVLMGCGAPDEPAGQARQPVRSLLFERAEDPLLPKDLHDYDLFGSSIGVSSRWAAIGAPGVDFDDSSAWDDTGGAIVFARTRSNSWQEVTTLRPPQRFPDGGFGNSIATTDTLMAIGAPHADPAGDGTTWGAGLVATFAYQSGTWQFESFLRDDHVEEDRSFGFSLAMDDGSLCVGAPGGDRVFVFTRAASGWSDPVALTSPSAQADGSLFGFALALQDPYLFVGAPHDNGDGTPEQADLGAVYVFKRSSSGWVPEGQLERNNFDGRDLFGYAVAVRKDLVVGTSYGDTSATIFRLDDAGRWGSPARVVPRDAANSSAFGRSAAIGTRDSVWIGAAREQNLNGVAFPFLLEDEGWVESSRVSFSDGGAFGSAMASASGALMVGAPQAGKVAEGAVYVIETSDGSICTQDDDCFSTNCVAGVCCNTRCDDACHSCLASEKGPDAIDGVCEPKRAGLPDAACADQGSPSCGTTGLCDGAGSCAKYRAGTQCAESFCSGNALVRPALCNGSGDCEHPAPRSCKSYSCNDGACQDACSRTADCSSDSYCVDGQCQPLHGDGAPCSSAEQCRSGNCSDKVCCDQACSGDCESCAESGAEGTCVALREGSPPRVSLATKSTFEICARLFSDGVERGFASQLAQSNVVCSPAGCTRGVEVGEGRCDAGQCVTASQECGAYACGPEQDSGRPPQCLTSCTSVNDCAPDYYCTTDNRCQPIEMPRAGPQGCALAAPAHRDWSCLLGAVGLAMLGVRRGRRTQRKEPYAP